MQTQSHRDTLETAGLIAQIVAALVAIFGIPILVAQLWSNRKQARSDRTRTFQERYFEPEFHALASRVFSFLDVGDASECVRKIKAYHKRSHADDRCLPRHEGRDAPRASVNDVDGLLNFFEEVGTAYNCKDLTKTVMHRSFAFPPMQILMKGWWYICWLREGKLAREDGDETFVEFEDMVKAIRKAKPNLAVDEPNPAVRILSLPSDPKSASQNDWDTSARLAAFLSEGVVARDKQPRPVASLLDALRSEDPRPADRANATPGWQLIFVPPDIDQGLRRPPAFLRWRGPARVTEEWRLQSEDLRDLAQWLSDRPDRAGRLAAISQ